MTPKGKAQLVKSLSIVIQQWLEGEDPNSSEKTDIGYVGKRTVTLMATVAITALELSAEAQSYAAAEGYTQ
jgi:hypothetical protein